MQNLLLGMQRIYEYNFVDLAWRAFYLVTIVLLLLLLRQGVLQLVMATTMIAAATAATFAWLVRKRAGVSARFDSPLFKEMTRYGFKAYIATLFAYLVIRSDMLLVNYFLGTRSAGYYSLSVSLTDWLMLTPITVAAMLFPKATAIADSKSELTRKVSRHMVVVMAAICLLAAALGGPAILFAYGQAYEPAIRPFLLLLPGVFFLALQTIYMQDFAARGMPPIVYLVPGAGFVVNVLLNMFLIPRFGIAAASVTSSVAYFVMFVAALTYFRRISSSAYHDMLVVKPAEILSFVTGGWRGDAS